MTASLTGTVDRIESSFDARWARWQDAGAAQDRTLDRRAAGAAVLAFCALATWLATAVYW